ncbi:MAG: TlpA family protein disulfide reductase [Pseudobacter sp.]|uniref:TlpA family protein disulfide reductase n=1 Tax=Pseudobacter sp. TaxID=2045420 RepID=UPI003F7D9CD8
MHRRYPVIQQTLLFLLISLPLAGIAQTSFKKKIEANPVKAYTVGDRLPDMVFKNLINYKSDKLNLGSLKGKLILVDFWELSCTNCMAAFPKIQKAKQQFGDKVEVITVNRIAST